MNITYRGKTPEQVGAWLASIPVITPSTKNRNEWTIPNHDGELIDAEFGRTDAYWDIYIHAKSQNWDVTKRAIEKWLSGTGKLIMSSTPDSYYEVKDVTATEVTKKDDKYGRYRVSMRVYPYEFLTSGDTGITSFPITNDAMASKPLFKIVGSGSGTLTVNGHTMTYTVDGTLYIDTRRFIAYDANNVNKSKQVNGDYAGLYLKEGTNTIAATLGTLTVYPKWGYVK